MLVADIDGGGDGVFEVAGALLVVDGDGGCGGGVD